LRLLLIAGLALLFVSNLNATHNRAGEITYQQIGPLTIRMTITTYTKESSIAADRDSLEVFWGDGLSQWVKRSNGKGQSLDNDVKLNYYTAEHTYPGRSTYTISFLDPNRSGNIVNINFPRSDEIPFYLATRFTLLDLQFQGYNNSAVLLQPPVDVACVGQPFIHNPNAYDADGDSLSYELIAPLSGENQQVPNYFFPNQILPGSLNNTSLNPVTGEFRWEFPPQIGEYNIAMRINEWRNGVKINSIIRDMQILVRNCNTTPPIIEVVNEICVVAGTTIQLPIKVSDKDLAQKIRLTATGGPFVQEEPAVLIAPTAFTAVPFEAELFWQTTCNHISNEYYQIVFKAIDNAFGDTFGLATLKTIRIKVVGPSVENLRASATGPTQVRLTWNLPYACDQTKDDYFFGFSVWRRELSHDLEADTCNPGTLFPEYTRLVFNTLENANNQYFFEDNTVKNHTTYCYRVLAEFALKTSSGNPFRKVESLPSDEVCLMLRRDIPLFVKASVDKTDILDGEVSVRWSKPLLSDFDTTLLLPPYVTQLYHRPYGTGNFELVPGSEKSAGSFQNWIDTSFVHKGINTLATGHEYQLQFFIQANQAYGEVPTAGTPFLTITPGDQKNNLSWESKTPWSNKLYTIFKETAPQVWLKIGESRVQNFTDNNVQNGVNYCYRIESTGTYAIAGIEDPILNFSQRACSIPVDQEAPCEPLLNIKTICDAQSFDPDELINQLEWNEAASCNDQELPDKYRVYFKQNQNEEFQLIVSLPGTVNTFEHLPDTNDISGCYIVTAVDKVGNESAKTVEVCVSNCPVYELPNTFTPNGDGENEVFRPMKNYFIHSIDMKIFNEWGGRVFSTTLPQIMWNGKDEQGKDLADGSYYYHCTVYVKSSEGLGKYKELKGYINILR
jgi:gliding motility-associated-like protein